jgi:CelD/BcsL family acetyltransferase involved in cellulose biosynthesis
MPWWRHIARGELMTLAIRDRSQEGELVGLLPLYLFGDPISRRRRLFPIGIATTDYMDLLAAPGREAEVADAVLRWLADHREAWDELEFPQLRADSALLNADAAPGLVRRVEATEPNPVLSFSAFSSIPRYSGGGLGRGSEQSGDVRTNPRAEAAHRGREQKDAPLIPQAMEEKVRYYRRRAEREASVAFDFATQSTVGEFLDAFVRLHSLRNRERGEDGVLSDPRVVAHHRDAAPQLLAAGLLRLYALSLNGQRIAALYALADPPSRAESRHYYYLSGFDPAFSHLSLGTLLIAHAIEQAAGEGATAFDFLRGREPYKYHWGAQDQPMYTLRLCHK